MSGSAWENHLFKRVLLVEDNPDDEALTRRALKRCDPPPTLEVCRTGPEALERLFDETQELPDLVLLDIRLPMISGLEMLQRLRKNPRTQQLCIIVLTSSAEAPDVREAYRAGANSYLTKPVLAPDYENLVELLGEYWLRHNAYPKVVPDSDEGEIRIVPEGAGRPD